MFRRITRMNRDPREGSVVLAISDALDSAREGARDDEAIAFLANKVVRKSLDKRAIRYEQYKNWRRKNPLIFTSIVDDTDQLIGFFDIFPLTPEAGRSTIGGALTERSFTIDHILPLQLVSSTTHVHIATVLVSPKQKSFSPLVARELVLLKMFEFIERHYPPIETRSYTAYAQSKAGEALLRRSGFSVTVLASDNVQHWPLYVLRAREADRAALRFGRAGMGLSTIRREQTELKELDLRIEAIELKLRAVITKALESDAERLPSNISGEVDKRIRQAARKNVVVDIRRYRGLPHKLEYFDLRELESTIVNNQLWPMFEARFVNKDTFRGKFDQLAELRNGIRHSRTVNEITRKEGEAGILWFESVLRNPQLEQNTRESSAS
jgi:hypothetical protein